MILNAHTEGIDEYGKEYTLLKILVIDELFRPASHGVKRVHTAVDAGLDKSVN